MRSLLTTVLVVLAGASAAFGECSAADKAALEAFDRAWGASGTAGDQAALTSIYADDYKNLPAGGGKAAAIANAVETANRLRGNPAARDTVTHDHYSITCSGSSATVMHRNTITPAASQGSAPTSFYTRSVHILEKRGGKWQVVSDAGGPINDAGALWYLEQDWNNAIWKKDKGWFEKHYADDFTSIASTSGKLMSRAEDIADSTNEKGTVDWAETTDMDIRIEGNTAIVTGVFHTKGKDDKGTAFDRKMRYTDVWIKRDNRWVAWSSQGTVIPAN